MTFRLLIGEKSIGSVFVILLGSSFCFHTAAQTNSVAKTPSSSSPEMPAFFETTNAISSYFNQTGAPAEMRMVKTAKDTYCFVLAYPYSGIDTTDLYCFAKRDGSFRFFLKAFIWKTPFKEDIQFKPDDGFVDVTAKGVVVLKIDPPQ